MVNLDRHAAIALLESVVTETKRYSDCCCLSGPFSEIDTFFAFAKKVVLTRGLPFLLVDLPDLGKAYDKGLSTRYFDTKSIPQSMGKYDGAVAQSLLSASFDEKGRLSTSDPNVVFFTRQILNMFKKLKMQCPQPKVKDAVDEFVKIESGLRVPTGTWDSDIWINHMSSFSGDISLLECHPRSRKLWKIVDIVFATITPQSEIPWDNLIPRHGPGAVADMKTGGDKYLFPHWPSKLEGTFPFCLYGQHREDLHITEEETYNTSLKEPAARLISVPKTFKGPRLIASEPIAHQFLQQGLLRWIRENLSPILRNSIDFHSQEPSKEAALQASRDGRSATVDLSSASDRLTCWTVERAFQSNQSLLNALHAVRTRCVVDATGTDDSMSLKLRKFAAQGSAVTFPVQTIIYAGLCYAAVLFDENLEPTVRNIRKVSRRVRVFGDDIVIPSRAVPILGCLLDSLQLKVNAHKTHTSGAFRESCGMDAFMGTDVTPCYVSHCILDDTSADTLSSWIDVSNNAFKKGLWILASHMDAQVPDNVKRMSITTREPGGGIRFSSFCHGFVTDAKVRMCKHLHRDEFKSIELITVATEEKRLAWNNFYQWLVESPPSDSRWTSGYVTRKRVRLVPSWVPIH